jgi:acyl-CoA thioesterase I
MKHLMAALTLAALLFVAGGGAHAQTTTCGSSRPSLDGIPTAEGLVIAPDGTIYFSQPFAGSNQNHLGRHVPPYDRPADTRWLDLGGNALGITLDPQRNVLYAGSRTLKKMLKVTLGTLPVVSSLAEVEEGVNGVTLGPEGVVYYSDQGGGHIYRITAEGTKARVTATPLQEPNGVAFGPDGKLYTVSWATPDVTQLTLTNGTESGRRVLATLPQPKADGLAFDAKGRLYVTASSTLYEISPDGRDVTPLGRSAGANIDFGAGTLACTDMYIAGNGQGLRRFQHDTTGMDVPWHRTAGGSAPPSPPLPPQISFPGQYAAAPAEWRFSVAPSGCTRFQGDEKAACLQFVAYDFGRLSRYAAANAALAPSGAGERRVVFLGDSITDNWSKAGYGGFFPGKPYVNRGIGAQTTSQMLLRFRPDVLDLHPKAVVILAGTNDIAGNSGPVTPELIQANVATMAELARLHGVKVVLASILPISDDKLDRSGRPLTRSEARPPATIRALNAWMEEYARSHGHVYLDYFSACADAGGFLRPELNDDGLHPNAKGYAVMAPLAEKAIAEALRQ